MRVTIGIAVIFLSVLGGYLGQGGHFEVLIQPFEALIIIGAAFGAFIIGNTGPVLKQATRMFGTIFRGPRYNKQAYVDLLGLQFTLFKLVHLKGVLALEEHIENPEESRLFQSFPSFMKHHHAVEFLCDYLRMVTLGTRVPHEMDALMEEELETHEQENHRLVSAVQALAAGTPALGIVAAVLGVIHTMGSISEPPEVLGHMLGGALVGTFLGVFVAYGFFGPMAQSNKNIYEAEHKYLLAIKVNQKTHKTNKTPTNTNKNTRKAQKNKNRPTF